MPEGRVSRKGDPAPWTTSCGARGDYPVIVNRSLRLLQPVTNPSSFTVEARFRTEPSDRNDASMLIGVLLGVMAVVLAVANGRLLLGRAADRQLEDEIRDFIAKQPAVESVESLSTRVIGPSMLRLACEIEFHGSAIVDREQITREAQEIRDGSDPAPILVDSARRMVRRVGSEINALEQTIRASYPQVVVIDLEVH